MKKSSSGKTVALAGLAAVAIIGVTVAIYALGPADSGYHRFFTGMFSPITRVVTNWKASADEKDRALNEYDALLEENRALKQKLQDTESLTAEASALQEENQRLRRLLQMKETNQDLTLVSGNLVMWNDAAWSSSFTVDVGADDGLVEGNAVITEDGLLGFVTSVSKHTAIVSTIVDTSVSARMYTVQSRVTAVGGGSFELMRKQKLAMKHISTDEALVTGETVRTVESETVPGDLIVGQIAEIVTEDGGLSETAVLLPAADTEHITQVFIVTDFTDTVSES